MKSILIPRWSIIPVLILLLPVALLGQSFEARVLNRGPLYGTASILQDYDNDADLDIIVTRRSATTEPIPSSVELLENDGTGKFVRRSLFSENLTRPIDIDAGDLDGDDDIDYLVCDNNSSSGKLGILENEGHGALSLLIIEDSTRFDQAAIADFDDDGDLDFVAVSFSLSAVGLYVNNGSLNFERQVLADDVTQVDLVEANDIDDDGDVDIIFGGGDFRILFNGGEADFDSTKVLITLQGGYSSARGGIAITDLNHDGVKDIVTFRRVAFGGLYFLDGANDFNFSLIEVDGIDLGGDVVVLDIDGNGLGDIVRQNTGDDYIAVLYQESVLEFRRELLEINWDNRGRAQMSVGDLDGDGDPDLVLAENGNVDGDVSWYENIAGRLYRHTLFGEIQAPKAARLSDLDGDGDLDVVITAGDKNTGSGFQEDEVLWYENLGDTQFLEWRIDDAIAFPADLELANLDQSPQPEVVVTANKDSALVYYRNNHPDWVKVVIDSGLQSPLACTVADLDGDGTRDILLCESGANRVSLYANDGSGHFTQQTLASDVHEPREIEAADFDNDEDLDLVVVAADTNNSVVLFLSDGSGGFERRILATGQMATDVEVGDWDGNATPDILVSFDRESGTGDLRDVALFSNDGDGDFTDSDVHQVWERTRRLKLADLDGDGDLDLILGGNSVTVNDGFQVLVNDGGSVASVVNLSDVAVDIFGVDAGDVNGDGTVEIVATDRDRESLLLLLGDFTTDVAGRDTEPMPSGYALFQNYPNPFNPSTRIAFALPEPGQVSLEIYNVLGQKVRTLISEALPAGSHHVVWDALDDQGLRVTSGVYVYRLQARDHVEAKKMILLE